MSSPVNTLEYFMLKLNIFFWPQMKSESLFNVKITLGMLTERKSTKTAGY